MERILFNIPEIAPSEFCKNSYFLSFESLIKYIGYDLNYEFLLGTSLHAFRTNIYPDLSLSSMDSFTGFNTAEYLLNVLGMKWETRMGAEDEEGAPLTVMKIVDSINRGLPVIAIHLDYTENWGLITGYGENVSNFYGLFFNQETKGSKIVTSWPFIAVILNETAVEKTKKEIVSKALENLVYVSTPGMVNGYYNGKLGIEYIIESKLYDKEESRVRTIFKDIRDNRKVAVSYLEKYGNETGISHLSDLIKLYKEEAGIDMENEKTEEICRKFLKIEEKLLDKM